MYVHVLLYVYLIINGSRVQVCLYSCACVCVLTRHTHTHGMYYVVHVMVSVYSTCHGLYSTGYMSWYVVHVMVYIRYVVHVVGACLCAHIM